MDSHTYRAFERVEVVESGRRRRWSDDEKLKIVLESLSGPRLVSATVRRLGISRSQLVTWRRAFRAEPAYRARCFKCRLHRRVLAGLHLTKRLWSVVLGP
ncbi:MAG: transposase [Devosia sp.]